MRSKGCRAPRSVLLAGGFLAWSLAAVGVAASFDYGKFLEAIPAPPGFALSLAAGDPEVRFPMFACFDDRGRLYVAESSGKDLYAGLKARSRDCRVLRLEDTDQDGRFEAVQVFQDRVTFPMGLVWHEGRLYVADPPDLVALTDSDGDGRADRREIVLTGFGHTDNGSLHGLTFGPDGRLYFTMGEPDGWKIRRGDGTYLEGVAGALFRCRPDGTALEVVSRGFVNLVEAEFLPGGEIIGTDNWYQVPAGGFRDALVDCAPGGLYPYAPDRGTPLPRTGLVLPPVHLLPAVAHSGLTRLRLNGFPPEWRDSLLVAEHNTRALARHALRPDGSTFSSTRTEVLLGRHPDFHPSDVLEAPDGSVLVVDTGGWYVEHCPTGRIRDSRAPGGLYRLRWKAAPSSVATPPAERALAAIWRLPSPELLRRLDDGDPATLTTALRATAVRRETAAAPRLSALLKSDDPRVRRAAAEALAECGNAASVPSLVAALAAARDDFERHACIHSLLRLAGEPAIRGLLGHPSTVVRIAALHLLDQPPFGTLRVGDLVPALAEAGMRSAALPLLLRHPAWAADALPWLRTELAAAAPAAVAEPAASAAGALLVAFQGEPPVRSLVSELLAPGSPASPGTRAFLLGLLPSLAATKPDPGWLAGLPAALRDPALRPAAIGVAKSYPSPEWEVPLLACAEDPAVPPVQRFHAARAATRSPRLSPGLFALVLQSLAPEAAAPDRLAAVDLLARATLQPDQVAPLLTRLEAASAVSLEALLPTLLRAAEDTTRPALAAFFRARLEARWSPDRASLDRILEAFPRAPELQAALRASWEAAHAAMLRRLAEARPLLAGGDATVGREVFQKATCAGCHRIGAQGGLLGPDLTRIGAIRSGGDLLESILYPSSSFAQGYQPHLLVRRDGSDLTGGLVSQEPDAVTLRDGSGVLHRIPAEDIATLTPDKVSPMPEGLDQLLAPEEFRDLLAYLQSLK